MNDKEWTSANANGPHPSSSPLRLPATPPSASLLGPSQSPSSSQYARPGQYPSQHSLPPTHQRTLPPIPIQPYTTPPGRQTQSLPPIHSVAHQQPHLQYHAAPPNAPPTPGETPWDLRHIDVYRLDEQTLRHKLLDAIQYIQHLTNTLNNTKTSLAQYTLQNNLLRNESREISQRSAVETELAKREVEVLLREYAAQMPSANQLANTYYRRYRGLKRRVKDLESVIETKESEIKRLQEYVRESGVTVPREGTKRTRRTGLKYAPRGSAWTLSSSTGKSKSTSAPRALKPAPSLQSSVTAAKDSVTSQETQSSGLDALGMLASQVLDSQEPASSQKFYPPSTQSFIPSTPSQRLPPPSAQKATLLSPIPFPTPTKRRRAQSQASDCTDHDPGLTEEEKSPIKVRVMGDSDVDEEEVHGSLSGSQKIPYASNLPIPYRSNTTIRNNGPDLLPGGPRRKLNFDAKESELLNHDS